MPVKLADLFRTQNVRKRDRICIICIDMASVKCTLPPHIAENRIPLSSSNSSQKPGTACSAIRSGFSFSRKTRFGPFPGLMVSFINNLRVSLSYGSPSAMPFSIPKAGKINGVVHSFGTDPPDAACSVLFRAASYCARENTIRSVGRRFSSSAGISTGSFPSALHTPKQASSPAGRLADQELPSGGSSGMTLPQ